MKVYLGIIGKKFAGKETVYNIIKELTKPHGLKTSIHHFSDPLNEILDILRLPKDGPEGRPNQQKLSTILRQAFSENVLGDVIMARAQADIANIVCLDGVRRPQDVIKLRGLSSFHLVSINTPPEKRFEFGQKRTDRPTQTWEEFLAQENAEAESKIDEIAKQADIRIDNFGTVEDLKMQILAKILVRKLGISITKKERRS